MKRDMGLIRDILLSVQSRKDLETNLVEIPGHDEMVVGRHVELLFRAGLVEGIESGEIGGQYSRISVSDLSWQGHDFIAALENAGVWGRIKKSFSAPELAGLPLSVIKDIGIGLLKEWAKSKVGLSSTSGTFADI